MDRYSISIWNDIQKQDEKLKHQRFSAALVKRLLEIYARQGIGPGSFYEAVALLLSTPEYGRPGV